MFLFDLRPCEPWGWQGFSGLGQMKWADEKCEACLLCHWSLSLSVSVSCSLLLFVYSVIIGWCFFSLSWGAGMTRSLLKVIKQCDCKEKPLFHSTVLVMHVLFLHIGVYYKLLLPFRLWHCLSSILLEAFSVEDVCSALQVHVSASKSSSYIFNKAFSSLFILESFVPPALTYQTMRGAKGYMAHSIDCSQKYFQRYGSR